MKKVLHFLIIAEIVSICMEIIIDNLFEKTLPKEILEYIARSETADESGLQLFAVISGVVLFILQVVAWIGLWKFWQPARLLYTLCLSVLVIYLFIGPVIYFTPLGTIFHDIGTLSAGMIIGVIYFSEEVRLNFIKSPEPNNSPER